MPHDQNVQLRQLIARLSVLGIAWKFCCQIITFDHDCAGATAVGPSPVGSDDDFAALPASSQQPAAAAPAAAGAGVAAAADSGLVWNKTQGFALHDFVISVLDLQGGHDDNPRLWEDVAAKSDLWGPNKVTPAGLQEVYLKVRQPDPPHHACALSGVMHAAVSTAAATLHSCKAQHTSSAHHSVGV